MKPYTKELVKSYLNEIKTALSEFETELDNISDKGFESQLHTTLIHIFTNSQILLENIEIAKLWNKEYNGTIIN